MADGSVFISSLSRRELARRRPRRGVLRRELLIAFGMLVVVLVAFVLVNGGV